MDFEAIKRAAEGYRADMSRFLRDMIAIPSESCEEKGVVMRIKQELEKKLDWMVMRDLYGKFKTAPTEEERERARKEYLDRRGVQESFRWQFFLDDKNRSVACPCG